MAPTIASGPAGTTVTVPGNSSLWDRISNWASENKGLVYTIAGVAVVVTGAGVVYYIRKGPDEVSRSTHPVVNPIIPLVAAVIVVVIVAYRDTDPLFSFLGVCPKAQQEGEAETETGREGSREGRCRREASRNLQDRHSRDRR